MKKPHKVCPQNLEFYIFYQNCFIIIIIIIIIFP